MIRLHHRSVALLGLTGMVAALSGCAARVSRKDFEAEVAKLREEQVNGDRALSARLDTTDARVAEHSSRLDELEKNLQALRSEFNTTVERMHSMLRFNAPIHFGFDDATIREADMPVLDRFASVVKQAYPDARITVEGFADPAGSAEYNLRLGKRRAEAVARYLTSQGGLSPDQIKTVSYGEARNRQVVPGAHGPGEQGVENRRVTMVIDYHAQQPTAAQADSPRRTASRSGGTSR
ncbi:MAG TPA: OmpA family protein [Gemmatimonadales bacterium]|nr:OmpA family protein [Gemmatimonadales bacterium]